MRGPVHSGAGCTQNTRIPGWAGLRIRGRDACGSSVGQRGDARGSLYSGARCVAAVLHSDAGCKCIRNPDAEGGGRRPASPFRMQINASGIRMRRGKKAARIPIPDANASGIRINGESKVADAHPTTTHPRWTRAKAGKFWDGWARAFGSGMRVRARWAPVRGCARPFVFRGAMRGCCVAFRFGMHAHPESGCGAKKKADRIPIPDASTRRAHPSVSNATTSQIQTPKAGCSLCTPIRDAYASRIRMCGV